MGCDMWGKGVSSGGGGGWGGKGGGGGGGGGERWYMGRMGV